MSRIKYKDLTGQRFGRLTEIKGEITKADVMAVLKLLNKL